MKKIVFLALLLTGSCLAKLTDSAKAEIDLITEQHHINAKKIQKEIYRLMIARKYDLTALADWIELSKQIDRDIGYIVKALAPFITKQGDHIDKFGMKLLDELFRYRNVAEKQSNKTRKSLKKQSPVPFEKQLTNKENLLEHQSPGLKKVGTRFTKPGRGKHRLSPEEQATLRSEIDDLKIILGEKLPTSPFKPITPPPSTV